MHHPHAGPRQQRHAPSHPPISLLPRLYTYLAIAAIIFLSRQLVSSITTTTATTMAYTDDAVLAKLSALNESHDSIATTAQWIMFHR